MRAFNCSISRVLASDVFDKLAVLLAAVEFNVDVVFVVSVLAAVAVFSDVGFVDEEEDEDVDGETVVEVVVVVVDVVVPVVATFFGVISSAGTVVTTTPFLFFPMHNLKKKVSNIDNQQQQQQYLRMLRNQSFLTNFSLLLSLRLAAKWAV